MMLDEERKLNVMDRVCVVSRERFLQACRKRDASVDVVRDMVEVRDPTGKLIGIGDYEHKLFVLDPFKT